MYISGQLPARRKLYKPLLRAYNESLYCLHLRECFMGPIASLLVFFGAALLLISWVYLIIISFKTDYAWGFMSIFMPPLAYLYSLFVLGKTWQVLALAFVGSGMLIAGLV